MTIDDDDDDDEKRIFNNKLDNDRKHFAGRKRQHGAKTQMHSSTFPL